MRIWTLSERQAKALQECRDTEGGVYLSIFGGGAIGELIDGDCAEVVHGKLSTHDRYAVPTEYGLKLLAAWEKLQ